MQRVEGHGDHYRLAGVQVGQPRRPRLHLRAFGPAHREPLEYRRLQLGEQLTHARTHLLDASDVGEAAAAELRGARHEVAVGRRADADREKPRPAETRLQEAEQRLFVSDRAVGEEHDLPHARLFVPAIQRKLQRRRHLGTAAGIERGDPVHRAAHVLVRRIARLAEERLRGRVELDHLEAVCRL